MSEKNPKPPFLMRLDENSISWFDKLIRRIDRLPGPYWFYYLIFGFALAGIGLLIEGVDKGRTTFGFKPIELLLFFQIVYMLILITLLYKLSKKAFIDFLPNLKIDVEQTSLLEFNLTSNPARSFNRLSIIFLIFFCAMGIFLFKSLNTSTQQVGNLISEFPFTLSPFGYYSFVVFTILWYVNTIFIFNTIHQLRVINFAFTQLAEINLFNQTELYAFSRVLAARGIGIVLTSPIWLLIDSGIITLIINIVFSTLALIIFIIPLVGVHRLLESQKDKLIRESMLQKEALIQQVFFNLQKGKLKDAGELKESISSLNLAHAEIEKVSTWPWQTNTIRQITGAITLPIVIWGIQYFLSRMLEG